MWRVHHIFVGFVSFGHSMHNSLSPAKIYYKWSMQHYSIAKNYRSLENCLVPVEPQLQSLYLDHPLHLWSKIVNVTFVSVLTSPTYQVVLFQASEHDGVRKVNVLLYCCHVTVQCPIACIGSRFRSPARNWYFTDRMSYSLLALSCGKNTNCSTRILLFTNRSSSDESMFAST